MEQNESRQQRRAKEREKAAKKQKQDRQLSDIVGGLVDGKRFDEYEPWEGRGLPTRENCDLTNPRQKFLWCFTAPPGQRGAPLAMPTEAWELMSWRLCVLGGDLVHEPGLKWQAPANVANPWTAAGKWVHPSTPEPERKTFGELFRALPQQDRAEIRAAILHEIGIEDERLAPDRPGPPPMEYTAYALSERLGIPVADLLVELSNLGLANLQPHSRVGREVGDRIIAHLGLD